MRIFRILSWLLAVLFFGYFAQTAMAQDDPNFEMGLKPYGSYQGGNIDSVSLGNGSLSVEIPLISYPQRGGKLSLDFSLIYQNKSGYIQELCDDDDGGDYCWDEEGGSPGGFQFVDKSSVFVVGNGINECWYGIYDYLYCNYQVGETDGAVHQLAATGPESWVSTDATGYIVSSDFTSITDRHGTQYSIGESAAPCFIGDLSAGMSWGSFYPATPTTCAASRQDLNGNEITVSSTAGWTDTIGRTIPPPVTCKPGSETCNFSTLSAKCPTGPYSISYVATWAPPGVGSTGTYPITFCYVSEYENFTPDDSDWGFLSPDLPANLLQSVVLPNNTTWQFTYTTDGLYNLQQITFPIGGTINYSWGRTGFCPLDADEYSYIDVYTAAVTQRVTNPNDGGVTGTWQYTYNSGSWPSYIPVTTMTDPANNNTVHTFGLGACALYETQTQNYNGAVSGTPIKTVQTNYSYILNPSAWNFLPFTILNVVPTSVETTLGDTSQVSEISYAYDTNLTFWPPVFFHSDPIGESTGNTYGNLLAKYEYDYGSGSPGSLLRTTATSYQAFSSSSYLNKNLLDLPSWVEVTDGSSNVAAYTTYSYDESIYSPTGCSSTTPCGNNTTVSRYTNSSNHLDSHIKFNSNGMQSDTYDANGNHTCYTYDSTGMFVYELQHPAPTSGSTCSTTLKEYFSNDTHTGLLTSHTDENTLVTSYGYDTMERLTSVALPDGGSDSYTYTDNTPPNPYYTYTKAITPSINFGEKGTVDGFGRLVHTKTTVPSSTCSGGYVYVDTAYDDRGNKGSVSNPYCTTGDTTYGVTSYKYDYLKRVCLVVPQDSSVPSGDSCPTSPPTNDTYTAYSGSCTTVTDQAGKARKSCTDGLGRMTGVWEDPSGVDYETDYTYDALDNLASVSQSGSRGRTFTYDWVSRLLTAANPESGTINYTYDNDGNLATKVAPQANQPGSSTTTTTYCYDALNRMTQKRYASGSCPFSSPDVSYSYDGSGCPSGLTCYNNGHRTGMSDAAGSETWSYYLVYSGSTKIGAGLTDQRTTNSYANTFKYSYNYDGSVATLTYPSGHAITYTPNITAQPLSAVDSTGTTINYAASAAYAPQGVLSSLSNGSSLVSTFFYDKRLQPCRISAKYSGTLPGSCTVSSDTGNVFDLDYIFNLGSSDNGNVAGITNNRDNTRSQVFTYDSLNRLSTAETTSTHSTSAANCWSEAYVYDQVSGPSPWGNLIHIDAGPSSYNYCSQESGFSTTVSSSNQLANSCYDAAGNNVGANPGTCSPLPTTYAYNAENQLTTTAGVTYTYDGDGKRVNKSSGTLYWYGGNSDPLLETDGSGNLVNEYVFFGGKRIARRDSSNHVFYYFADQLGSSRSIVQDGSTPSLCYDADFYPFGGERTPIVNTCLQNYKFTGKERDTESGLDNFGARYMSSQYGRFMSPDPSNLSVDFWLPQTWNRYSYVLNNPLSMVDRNGLWPTFWHDEIYEEALPGLSHDAMQLLEDASETVDLRPGGQDPENAFLHGMRNGNDGETVDQAEQDSDDSIAANQHNAQDIEAAWLKSGHSGIAPAALTAFANVAHNLSDRNSPTHRGFQKWRGTKGIKNKALALAHLTGELIPTPSEFQQSVQDVQNAFNQTFGQFGFDPFTYMELIQNQPQFCTSATDSSGNTVSGCD